MNDLILVFSLISLGFFGGFTHCSGMCGPFVLTQISNRLTEIPLGKFSNFEKLKNLALLPYHLGRITTYSLIGFFCSFLTKNLKDLTQFRLYSAFFLIAAGLNFLDVFFDKKISNFFFRKLKKIRKIRLTTHKKNSKTASGLAGLFKKSVGFRGYFLGLVLGFIPCGLLYGAFLISASISQPIIAAIGMALFGISTFPSLFLVASGGYFLFGFEPKKFRLVAKFFILINAISLTFMALGLIF